MVKKIFYALLFWTCITAFPSNLTANVPALSILNPTTTETCTAPPPDSLRAISIGSDFVTLGWNPAWVGADHTLSLFKKNGLAWDSLYTIPSVPGIQYTVQNLEPGTEYRIFMRTKCPNGDPGTEYSSIEITTLIVELTLLGKTPLEPMVVDCNNIDYLNPAYKWVGFRVYYTVGDKTISNYFEYKKPSAGQTQLRRAYTEHKLVAANEDKEWPTVAIPLQEAEIIRVGELLNNNTFFYEFGQIILSAGTTLKLCPDPNTPWHPFYHFEALVATKTSGFAPLFGDERTNGAILGNDFKAVCPFSDIIQIFNLNDVSEPTSLKIKLLDIGGREILSEHYEYDGSSFSIPADFILPGIYFLHIEDKDYNRTLRLVKTN